MVWWGLALLHEEGDGCELSPLLSGIASLCVGLVDDFVKRKTGV